jgi:hypothetical protein
MGAITGTLVDRTSLASYKIFKITCIPASASDTVTLTAATHKLREILLVIPKLTAGYDAALAGIFASVSGLVITLTTTAAAGTAATDWTGATADLLIIGK